MFWYRPSSGFGPGKAVAWMPITGMWRASASLIGFCSALASAGVMMAAGFEARACCMADKVPLTVPWPLKVMTVQPSALAPSSTPLPQSTCGV